MPLTNRQRTFLEKLLDVYHSHRQESIHYTDLARALGVANSTAYEVLKSLELKGYVCSEYRLAGDRVGPGRSMVLFRPSMKALRRFRRLLGEDARRKEWEFVKARVLERLSTEDLLDDDLVADLIETVPESDDPLSYCGSVLAASLVAIRTQLWNRLQESGIMRGMDDDETQSLDTLDLLPGVALGLSCASQRESFWLSRLAEHVRRYQSRVHELDQGARLRLLRFSREVMTALRVPVGTG